ncbi:MAG: hypothetical protein IRY91_01325 [Gemmatimonadaceae bacterium]|nr:hypothetical protein [Gemmatimonadaceae bacterium]
MRLGRRAALLALLLLALFTLSGLLALEAWSAAGKRRALAEQAMRQYASYAAAKYRDNVQGWLYVALDELFAGAWSRLAHRPAAFGDGAAALAESGRAFDGCACAPTVRGAYYFEIQLDSGASPRLGTIAIRGTAPPPAEQRWVADTTR